MKSSISSINMVLVGLSLVFVVCSGLVLSWIRKLSDEIGQKCPSMF